MKNVGKVIRNAIVEKKDWRHELNVFAMSYRSTPHSATGVAPTILLFGNNRTNRLPTIKDESNDLDKNVATRNSRAANLEAFQEEIDLYQARVEGRQLSLLAPWIALAT